MSPDMPLEIIRTHSKSYHKELDKIGLSKALYSQELPAHVYARWLTTTYDMLLGIEALKEQAQLPDYLVTYIQPDFTALENDIAASSVNPLGTYHLPVIEDPYLWIVPVYTYLGSMHGSAMIYEFIQKHQLGYPTTFLESRMSQKHLWKSFLEVVSRPNGEFSKQELADYTTEFWSVIHTRNVQDYASD